jgi:hypothetical protein
LAVLARAADAATKPKVCTRSKWAKRFWNKFRQATVYRASTFAPGGAEEGKSKMGRGILLWLLGVPIPIIILIALLYH